ncbi:MAG: FKBP-type peptidyl-prolyl cis-trans isomerase [Planctomycetales bacterium]
MKRFFVFAVMASMLTPALIYMAQASDGTNRTGATTTTDQTHQGTTQSPTNNPKEAAVDIKDVSYCIGNSFGRSIHGQDIAIDFQSFTDGFQAAMDASKARMTDEQMAGVMEKFQMQLIRKQMAAAQKKAEAAQEQGSTFLKTNKSKQGVAVTDSGLQYKVIEGGKGSQPKGNDSVTVHYRGTRLDGTVFDSSYDRNQPVTFQVDRVIPGWTEALQLMREGDKWELYIPSDLAYGTHGAGAEIGPNETLVFEVELIKVNPETEKGKTVEVG